MMQFIFGGWKFRVNEEVRYILTGRTILNKCVSDQGQDP